MVGHLRASLSLSSLSQTWRWINGLLITVCVLVESWDAFPLTYFKKNIPQCKLFILFTGVKHFQFGFGELAAVCSISCLRVKCTENWPQQQQQQQTNSWNQPLPLDLQCPLVWLATREEILPPQAYNSYDELSSGSGETRENTTNQQETMMTVRVTLSSGCRFTLSVLFLFSTEYVAIASLHAEELTSKNIVQPLSLWAFQRTLNKTAEKTSCFCFCAMLPSAGQDVEPHGNSCGRPMATGFHFFIIAIIKCDTWTWIWFSNIFCIFC